MAYWASNEQSFDSKKQLNTVGNSGIQVLGVQILVISLESYENFLKLLHFTATKHYLLQMGGLDENT